MKYFIFRNKLLLIQIIIFLVGRNVICDSEKEDLKVSTEKNESDTKDDEIPLTLLTLFHGDNVLDESLTRFIRRAIFNGFEEGTTLRVVQPKKIPTSQSVKLEALKGAIYKLAEEKKEKESLILYLEHEGSIVLSPPSEIVKIFKSLGTRILFSSDSSPCQSQKINSENKYINYAGFIGYAQDLKSLFSTNRAESLPQLIDKFHENAKNTTLIKIDENSLLFETIQNDSTANKLELKLNKDGRFLIPTLQKEDSKRPIHIIHTNLCKEGNSVVYLNSLGSYLTPTLPEDKIKLPEKDEELPVVTLAIFIEKPSPFMEEFFINIEDLDYPKNKIHLFVHNHYKYNSKHVDAFLDKNKEEFASVKYIPSKERVKEWSARKLAINWALEKNSDYLFSVDSTAHLDEEYTLRGLIEGNKLIISPMLCHQTDYLPNLCNWWGALTPDGFYAKSSDYDEIAEDHHKGIWNVPFVNAAYLIKASLLKNNETRPNFVLGLSDPDLAFSENNRRRGIFMHVTNEFHPGHYVSNEHFEMGHLHDELYQLFDNRYDWENRYIHPNYSKSLEKGFIPLEPCQDVFWFPIVTPRFASEMIEEMENYGGWADGSVEARGDLYPTVDIQMNEIGFDKQFHEFLRVYISPLQEKAFKDYEVYPPRTEQAFVVRYSAEDQRELKPHFDESTYTLNIALNTPHVDFEGGGCRFTRFNCSVVDTRLGWGFVHPGQFTHKHEGLKVTKGTRYILVSFVDPHSYSSSSDDDDSD